MSYLSPDTQVIICFETIILYIYIFQIKIIKRLPHPSGTRYLYTSRVPDYVMSSHTRETAQFSEMDAAMRQLGSWEPHPPGADA